MVSEKRIQAARINGARSRGPKTPEGRARSARNATRHGLLSRVVVLPSESEEDFQQLLSAHLARFEPADDVELGFIEEMTAAYWRQRRLWAIETRLLDESLRKQPGDQLSQLANGFKDLASSSELGLLQRYDTRLHVMYQRALKNLLVLRELAVRNEPKKSNDFNETVQLEPDEASPERPISTQALVPTHAAPSRAAAESPETAGPEPHQPAPDAAESPSRASQPAVEHPSPSEAAGVTLRPPLNRIYELQSYKPDS